MDNPLSANELQTLLQAILDSNAKQLMLARRQFRLLLSFALLLIVAMVVLLIMTGMTFSRLNTTLQNIEVITTELAEADLPAMISNIDELVTSSQTSVNLATEKISGIDFEALNQSIRDLQSIIQPLARLFGR
jgi:hypothetical protein